ncbi:MAG: hypothetical protein OQK09_14020 [Colwellia sp.]|nr:hypothetical protein [Colwellia sp.]MCW9082625.1 hypothetical protein [Colwellia sp.]
MALYSWFSDVKSKQSKHSQFGGKEPKESTINNKYLESYTMWPVAKVIHGEQVTPPLKKELITKKGNNTLLASPKKTPLCTLLAVKPQTTVYK